jgi:hypothetical protein
MRKEMAFEVCLYRAGGILTTGPDPSGYGAVIAGLGDWREIELLVQSRVAARRSDSRRHRKRGNCSRVRFDDRDHRDRKERGFNSR